MTEKKIIELLAAAGVPEIIAARKFSDMTGISYYTVRMAMAAKRLPKAARGIISRAAAAEWIARNPGLIAQLAATWPRFNADGRGDVCLVSWPDDVTITVRSARFGG